MLDYGYDVTGDYANSSSATFQVLNIPKLVAAFPDKYDLDQSHTSTIRLDLGFSSESYLQSVISNSGLSVTAGTKLLFTGSINKAFRDTLSNSSKYIFSSYDTYIQRKRLHLNVSAAFLQSYLNADFVNDVNTQTPAFIVSHYGTHVLIDIMLGAKLNVIYRSETRNASRYSASAIGIKASVAKVFSVKVNDSTSTTTTDVNKNYDQTLSITTVGGDPAQAILTTIPLDGTQVTPLSTVAWQNSCTDANSELVNIGSDGLIQLSDLIADPTKKTALANYINQYLIDHQIHLLPTQVYNYYSSSLRKNIYSINPNFATLFPNYASNAQPFKAYGSPLLAGTAVPVYQYTNPTTQAHALTLSSTRPAGTGWSFYNLDGAVFYASATNLPGTVALYDFYSSTNDDHSYTTNRNANFPTYTYAGLTCYVYPN